MLDHRLALVFVVVIGCAAGPPKALDAGPRPPAAPAATGNAAPAPETGVTPALAYPKTRTVNTVDVLHGVRVSDPYRWLENADSDEVRAWVDAESALARRELDALPERAALIGRFRELYDIERVGAPLKRGGRYFWGQKNVGQEKSTVMVKRGKRGKPEVLLDPNTWSADGSVSLGSYAVSNDGKTVVYQVKQNNSDEATLELIDVRTKKKLPDTIPGAKYTWRASFTPRGDGFYYVQIPPLGGEVTVADRPGLAEIKFHRLGTDPASDPVVRDATHDAKTFQAASLSHDGRFLLATVSHGWAKTDLYFEDLHDKKPTWKPLVAGVSNVYYADVFRGRFYVVTDEGAPHYRVFAVDPRHVEREHWQEIVAERPDVTIDSVSIVGGHLALVTIKDVVENLEIRTIDGKLAYQVELPGQGSVSLTGSEDEDEAYFSFQSFARPPEIHELTMRSGKTELTYQTKVPADPSKVVTEQLFATSRDGTQVPFFVLRPRGASDDGRAPAILYGYGGFSVAITPGFWTGAFPWLERGGVYVIANPRGGSEYGETWHQAGMRHQKQHVFDDFIAVGEELVKRKITSPDRLVIQGASNGGLLVGAAMTQRPELFSAVLCGVPLLDMLRYQLFGSGKTWIEEYGTADDPDDFRALYAYSPYHHVTRGTRYPAVLLLSADSDDRVDPMHARKFAAALQAASNGGPVLLRIQKNAGHGGADKIQSLVEERADAMAFALAHVAH